MEKLRFIADTDWQSNVDGRPSVSVGGSSDVKGYKLIPEAFPLMIKLPFFQFIRAFLFVLFLMVIFHALLSGVKR